MYTIETLIAINPQYHSTHRLEQGDVNIANKMVALIEQSRTNDAIQVGDIVEFTNRHGVYSRNAHIEKLEGEHWSVCERPQIPFIDLGKDSGKLFCLTSGGPWASVPNNLKRIGKRKKFFCDWGLAGACGSGAINFEAEVNVWEYAESHSIYGEYTTKDWDKHYVSYCADNGGNPKNGSPYRYFLSGKAFANEIEYNAWLRTYKGVEFKGDAKDTNWVVFCYKERDVLVGKSSWDGLTLPLDTRMCNGTILVKVEYDEANRTVTVYRFTNCGSPLYKKGFREFSLAKGIDLSGLSDSLVEEALYGGDECD
jgi:hypothetical protein